MKKLKTSQFVLLVIFYPVGIFYFIYWLVKRKKISSSHESIDVSKLNVFRDFHTKVVGVTFKNSNGSDRQTIVRSCKVGESVVFKPTPTEKYPDSIGVFDLSDRQLGHVNASLAFKLSKYPFNPMEVTISDITGGGDRSYGCNLHIIIYEK